jgi:hypothetical protein
MMNKFLTLLKSSFFYRRLYWGFGILNPGEMKHGKQSEGFFKHCLPNQRIPLNSSSIKSLVDATTGSSQRITLF